jgi:hypothetical protein
LKRRLLLSCFRAYRIHLHAVNLFSTGLAG